ncbi:MAG TPA: hypothetical protein VJP79_00935 [Nitrososphaera sp.]|nr:hypothetical protein [Nitrososphaera sp.]
MVVSQNTWKFLSIGILAVLAVSIFVPQASAHITNSTSHMLSHIYNFVDGIEAKTDKLPEDPADQSLIDDQLESIQADTDDIQSSIGRLSGGAAVPKTINADLEIDASDGQGTSYVILGFKNGVSYSGALSAALNVAAGNRVSVDCYSSDGLISIKSHENLDGPSEIETMSDAFACNQLRVSIFDLNDGVDAHSSFFRATTYYVENSDIQLITNQ